MLSADHRRRRGNAKGIVTRTAQTMNRYKVRPIESFDLTYFEKQGGRKRSNNTTTPSASSTMTLVTINTWTMGLTSVCRLCLPAAYNRPGSLQESSHSWLEHHHSHLESATSMGYSPFMDAQFSRLDEDIVDFTKLISPSFVHDHEEISALRLLIRDRWQMLSQLRADSVADKERTAIADKATAVSSKELRPLTQGLKVELPSFDGSILKWRGFSGLFSSVMKKNTQLNDDEKNSLAESHGHT